MRTSQRELSEALPFRVYGEWVFQLVRFPKNVNAVKDWDERNPFFFVFSSFFVFFCGSDNPQLYCQHITDTTPYSCGRRKFSLVCSHTQRPLRNLQSLLLRLIQPVPLQNMICCQKQFFSPEFLKLIGLLFDKIYPERKYTLSFEASICEILRINLRLKLWKEYNLIKAQRRLCDSSFEKM